MSAQFPSQEITSDDKVMAALSYIFSPIVPVILMLLEDKKNRPFIKFHMIQSLAVGVVMIILVPVLAAFTFGCGGILWFIMFYWGYKAYQGAMFEIPVVTNFLKTQGWL